jgi:hypothetical protein
VTATACGLQCVCIGGPFCADLEASRKVERPGAVPAERFKR